MPEYEANVLDRFADMIDKRMVSMGSRPVFWSVKQQRILGDGSFRQEVVLKDAIVSKLGIKKFGRKAARIEKLYPAAKLLVFTDNAWHLCAANALAINDRLSYILVRQGKEYYILAEKRLGEFISRFQDPRSAKSIFKTVMVIQGAELADMEVERPFGGSGTLPVLINRDLKPTFGTGISSVSPAHTVEGLKMAHEYNLSRDGCVDSETGFLTQPKALEGLDIANDGEVSKQI